MRAASRRRAVPDMTLLTIYGAVMEDKPPPPPAMATGLDVTVITTTVCPSMLPTPVPTGGMLPGNGTVLPAVVAGGAPGGATWSVVLGMMMFGMALVL